MSQSPLPLRAYIPSPKSQNKAPPPTKMPKDHPIGDGKRRTSAIAVISLTLSNDIPSQLPTAQGSKLVTDCFQSSHTAG